MWGQDGILQWRQWHSWGMGGRGIAMMMEVEVGDDRTIEKEKVLKIWTLPMQVLSFIRWWGRGEKGKEREGRNKVEMTI